MIGENGADGIPISREKDVSWGEEVFEEKDVGQNDYQVVDLAPDYRGTHILQTKHRAGCEAVLAWRQDPAGGDHLLMTHYDPLHVKDHLEVLRERFPRGEGIIRTVLLMGGADEHRNAELIQLLEQEGGTRPDIVMPGEDVLTLEALKRLAIEDPEAYQLVFIRGYNGNPQLRRIIVPAEMPRGSYKATYLYEKTF